MKRILITGISGFLGSHTAIAALNQGFEVLGTIRDIKKAESIKKIIGEHSTNINMLMIAEANLLDEEIWNSLMIDVEGVLHIASPFPRKLPKKEEDLLRPAKEGTLNVLRAASNNGVKKVILTSSIAAIAYGNKQREDKGIFNETDWTDETNTEDTTPYYRSKTIAEKAAWEFMENDTSGMELTTICPGAILGPVLEDDYGTSANLVLKLIDGSAPAIPNIGFEIVDVRDVADLHLLALKSTLSSGKRYPATSSYLLLSQVTEILKREYPKQKIPRVKLPNFLVRLVSNFIAELKPALLELGAKRKIRSQLTKEELNWRPRSAEEAVTSCANSLIELGIVC